MPISFRKECETTSLIVFVFTVLLHRKQTGGELRGHCARIHYDEKVNEPGQVDRQEIDAVRNSRSESSALLAVSPLSLGRENQREKKGEIQLVLSSLSFGLDNVQQFTQNGLSLFVG